MSLLVERAENYTVEDFAKVNLIDPKAVNFPAEYLLSKESWSKRPIYYMGRKGSGKTTVWRKALNQCVQNDPEFLPVVFTFKKSGKLEIMDPSLIAEPEYWGKRLEEYSKNPKDLSERASALIVDDIHYMCESCKSGGIIPEDLTGFLGGCLRHIDNGKKVTLISEDMLSTYVEKMNIKELDEMLPKFGMIKFGQQISYEDSKKMDFMAFREVPMYDYNAWEKLFSMHGLSAEESVKKMLFNSNRCPRAFVRFAKLLPQEKHVTLDHVTNMTAAVLKGKLANGQINSRDYNFYNFILSVPVIEDAASIKSFEDIYSLAQNNFERVKEMKQNLPAIEAVIETAAEGLQPPGPDYDREMWKGDPAYRLRRTSLEHKNFVLDRLQEAAEKCTDPSNLVETDLPPYMVESLQRFEDRSNYLKSISWAYCNNPPMSELERSHNTILDIQSKAENSKGGMKNLKRLLNNIRGNYIELGNTWLAISPFRTAFEEVLYEQPTLQILDGVSS
ncbi:MAG: hypothetical protein V1678_02130 [Candidatus Aenigmatarchaeota archaeon]